MLGSMHHARTPLRTTPYRLGRPTAPNYSPMLWELHSGTLSTRINTETEPTNDFFMETPTDLEKGHTVTALKMLAVLRMTCCGLLKILLYLICSSVLMLKYCIW